MSVQMIQILALVICANAIPVFLRKLFADKLAIPIDHGKHLKDGYPVLGKSKTWRGLLGSLLLTPLIGLMFGLDLYTGLMIAVFAMGGDLLSSFIKRRMGLASSQMAPFLDQLPESAFPFLYTSLVLKLVTLKEVAFGVILFVLLELILSRIFFHLGIRKRPY